MRFITTLLSLFILLSVIGGIAVILGLAYLGAEGPLREEKIVVIERGASTSAIAQKLENDGVISSGFLFKIAHRIFSKDALKAGEYRFDPKMPILAVVEKLEKGTVIHRFLTIPEGLTSYEIVNMLNANKQLEGARIDEIPNEGTLLPETYSYHAGALKNNILTQMNTDMTKALDTAWQARQEGLPIQTKKEALILASIIEKETGQPDERGKVAGVFINRLKKGMPLQTDPTVIYAITKGQHKNEGKGPLGRRLLKKDLQIESPYNTYKYAGLPPGPICNPGKDSLNAALNPEEHDYLYFVADGTGGHLFAKTLKEHNYNVANWRKIRKENERKASEKTAIDTDIKGPLFE